MKQSTQCFLNENLFSFTGNCFHLSMIIFEEIHLNIAFEPEPGKQFYAAAFF